MCVNLVHIMVVRKINCLIFFISFLKISVGEQCDSVDKQEDCSRCFGYYWNISSSVCTVCAYGFTGINCRIKCNPPYYGKECQDECTCNESLCDHVFGCLTTTVTITTLDSITSTVSLANHTPNITAIPVNNNTSVVASFYGLRVVVGGFGSLLILVFILYISTYFGPCLRYFNREVEVQIRIAEELENQYYEIQDLQPNSFSPHA